MNQDRFPYDKITLSDQVRVHAKENPGKTAINYYGREITFQQLDELSDKLSIAMSRLGYRKGDHIAAFVQSCAMSFILYLAAIKCGLIIVPIDPMSKEFEVEYFLTDSRSKYVVCMDTLYHIVKGLRGKCNIRNVITMSFMDFMPEQPTIPPHRMMQGDKVVYDDAYDCLSLIGESSGRVSYRVDPDSLGFILYTGGTTGWPKGCLHTQRDLMYCGWGQSVFNFDNASIDDVMLSPWPITHISGITLGFAVPLLTGMTVVQLARWDANAAMIAIDKYKISLAAMATPSYYDILDHPDVEHCNFGLLRVCLIVAFAIPITDELIRKWEEVTRCPLYDWGYSSSEHMNYAGYGCGIRFDKRPEVTSFAKPMPGVSVKIVDFDTRSKKGEGEEGEIVTRSPAQLLEYWNKPEVNNADILDGWLHTHDRGYFKEGILFFIGKASEIVKVSGYTVSLKEIEVFGKRHPAIDKIAVVALPHERKGNQLKAFITVRPGVKIEASELEEWFREKVAIFKVPIVSIRDELPMSGKGEILKRILIEEETA